MAQSKKSSGSKSSGSKSGKSSTAKTSGAKSAKGAAGAKSTGAKSGTAAKSKKASETLDSVRGGSQRQTSRAQDAARKAAGRSGGKSGTGTDAARSGAAKKNTAAKSSPAAAGKKSGGKNTAAKPSASQKKTTSSKRIDSAWKRMAIVAAVVVVGVVAAIQSVSCAHPRIDRRQAVMVTLSDTIETTGIAIRDERLITSDRQGVIVSTIENGGKVSKGETVANIFNSAEAARDYERMNEIRDTLEQFESMETAGEESASEVTALQKAIREEILDISERIYDGETSEAIDTSDELLYLLNKTQVATRVVEDFSHKVKDLENELDVLEAKYTEKPGQLNSPLSGYFISEADGYEALLKTEVCATLTPEKLDEIMKLRSEPNDSTIVGKIANDYIWYMACEVSPADAERLAKNSDGSFAQKDYKLYLTYSELDSITAKLVRVNTGADANRKVLIFECSYMVSELSTVRIQPVTIELSSYSGLEISAGSMISQEVTVSTSDVMDYDTEGREALARAIYPAMFGEVPEEVSGTDVSGADAVPDNGETDAEEDARYSVAAYALVNSTEKGISEIVAGLQLPETVTYTQHGVYVVWGSEIKYKRVLAVYQEGDKVLCKYNVAGGFLKMYDNVVDEPEEVYDGQIIDG